MSKKLVIVTVYDVFNNGSWLQAWALMRCFSSQECSVEFWKRDLKTRTVKRVKNAAKLGRLLLKGKKEAYRETRERTAAFLACRKRFPLTSDVRGKTVVIGSDTVWNFHADHFRTHRDLYLGALFPREKKCTYAASAANTTVEQFEKIPDIRKRFEDFDIITVRDRRTADIVEEITGKRPPVVCDPTFLLPAEEYKAVYETVPVPTADEPYILIYFYGKFPEELKQVLKDFREKTGWKICNISNAERRPWCDLQVPNQPDYFLAGISHAAFVVTNTFHGTAFSVIFRRPFLVYGKNKQKVRDLLDSLALSGRLCGTAEEAEQVLSEPTDYTEPERRLEEIRQTSLAEIRRIMEL